MKNEIRNDVREYILSEVNMTLARLGVSEQVRETLVRDEKYENIIRYQFESAPIRQMPMVFKKLTVGGYMAVITPTDEKHRYYKASEKYHVVFVKLDYRYDLFDGGSNGCGIGYMVFLVDKELPKSFEEDSWIRPEVYIRKVEGLNI